MRGLILIFMLIAVLAAPRVAASGACEHAVAPHGVGLVVVCDVVGHGIVVVLGDHQSAECPRSDRNVIVIVGDDNRIRCEPALDSESADCQGEPYAVKVSGEAHSCGLTIVLLGSGSGRIAIVGFGKAEGGTFAVVGDGCAAQNEEGFAIAVLSNSCGEAILFARDLSR